MKKEKNNSLLLPNGILSGVKVLDLTRMLSGPYCTMLLADHGADVLKIEDVRGDTSRQSGPYRTDDIEKIWSGYFVSLNRNKKSVVLNLKEEVDKNEFECLVETAHVVVENFRPGVMERLGLGYEKLIQINQRLVYGDIIGFGYKSYVGITYLYWPSYYVVAQ